MCVTNHDYMYVCSGSCIICHYHWMTAHHLYIWKWNYSKDMEAWNTQMLSVDPSGLHYQPCQVFLPYKCEFSLRRNIMSCQKLFKSCTVCTKIDFFQFSGNCWHFSIWQFWKNRFFLISVSAEFNKLWQLT